MDAIVTNPRIPRGVRALASFGRSSRRSRARSHPPERRAPNHAHATKHTHTHNLVVRTCYLTAPNPTAARFEVAPRVVGRTARCRPRRSLIEVNATRGIFFTPGYFYLLSCWLNFLFYMEDVLIFWFVNRRFKTMAKRGATRTGPRHFARARASSSSTRWDAGRRRG